MNDAKIPYNKKRGVYVYYTADEIILAMSDGDGMQSEARMTIEVARNFAANILEAADNAERQAAK